MMNLRTVAAATIAVALAACGNPTISAPERVTPSTDGTAFDSGVGFGSGGLVAPPSGPSNGIGFGSGGRADSTTVTSTNTTTACVDRSGIGFGSGGFTEVCP